MSDDADRFIKVVRRGGSDSAVTIYGAINVHNAARLERALLDALRASPNRLIVNLAAVDSIDASGLAVLVGAYHRTTAAGGWLLLERANADLANLLQQNGLPTIGRPTRNDTAGPHLA